MPRSFPDLRQRNSGILQTLSGGLRSGESINSQMLLPTLYQLFTKNTALVKSIAVNHGSTFKG